MPVDRVFIDGKRSQGVPEQMIRADGLWHLVVVVQYGTVRPDG